MSINTTLFKPLTNQEASKLLERTSNFTDCEIISITFKDAQTLLLTLNVQDKLRGYNWIGLELEYQHVSDAKLVENSALSFLDCSEGISILFDNNKIYFGVGQYTTVAHLKESVLYIEALNIKYRETDFVD